MSTPYSQMRQWRLVRGGDLMRSQGSCVPGVILGTEGYSHIHKSLPLWSSHFSAEDRYSMSVILQCKVVIGVMKKNKPGCKDGAGEDS